MFSNYSHDHIALDTLNIMANGQYIDQIMTNNQFYICILGVKVSRQGYIIRSPWYLYHAKLYGHVYNSGLSNGHV